MNDGLYSLVGVMELWTRVKENHRTIAVPVGPSTLKFREFQVLGIDSITNNKGKLEIPQELM